MNYGYNFNPMLMRSMAPMAMTPNAGISSLLAPSASKITFSGILNGASKTLGVINQAIPVFYQVKPIWDNAKTMMRVVKGINNNTTSVSNNKTSESKETKYSNGPTFFN